MIADEARQEAERRLAEADRKAAAVVAEAEELLAEVTADAETSRTEKTSQTDEPRTDDAPALPVQRSGEGDDADEETSPSDDANRSSVGAGARSSAESS